MFGLEKCDVERCPVTSCHVMSCHVMSCDAMSATTMLAYHTRDNGGDNNNNVQHTYIPLVWFGSVTATPLLQGSVEAVGFCATHPWVATAGTDGGLKVWDSVSGTCRHTCTHPAGVTKLEWHPATPVRSNYLLYRWTALFPLDGQAVKDSRQGTELPTLKLVR